MMTERTSGSGPTHDAPGGDRLTLSGPVARADGTPLPHTPVRIVRKGIRLETLLGETHTDARGNYTLTCPRAKPVVARALDANGAVLGVSALIAEPERARWINISIGGRYRGPSLF